MNYWAGPGDGVGDSPGWPPMSNAHGIADLIQIAQTQPPRPIVKGLLNAGSIALLHAPEESYKSFFTLQLGIDVAAGDRFLRRFDIPEAKVVGVIQTEIHSNELGQRLLTMFPDGVSIPKNLHFADEDW